MFKGDLIKSKSEYTWWNEYRFSLHVSVKSYLFMHIYVSMLSDLLVYLVVA
jgi:hypothetical protein